MRISTKIKHLLFKYRVEMDMTGDDSFHMILVDKHTGKKQIVDAESWSDMVSQGHKLMKNEIEPPRSE